PLVLALFVNFVLAQSAGLGQSIDPHAVFEERCSRCHTEHGADFARKSLSIAADGTVVSKASREPVARLLDGHAGDPSPAEIAALIDMFARQLGSAGLFRRKCVNCHKRAVTLARRMLVVREGDLVGRYTGNRMTAFLANHGRLEDNEIEIMTQMLRWHVETAAR
ncbi:MAG: hypothetical protein OEM91_09965, partial [Hyphomicrobiales bacterium]|nr:hypothetical protein [Hyphomicrobiales bacterium]